MLFVSMCVHVPCVTSFPGLPRFLFFIFLLFSFVQYNTRKQKSTKNGEGLGIPITWMTSGGCEVDVGGRGSHSNNVLDFIIECSNDSQDSWGSQGRQHSTSLVRNSLYCSLHTSWLMGNAPLTSTLRPPDVIHVIDVPRPSPFFTLFRFCVLYWTKPKNKKRGGLGTRLCLVSNFRSIRAGIVTKLGSGRFIRGLGGVEPPKLCLPHPLV